MNKARYEALPADLRAVIDANSGIALAKQIGRVWDEAEQPGRAAAKASGASFHSIEGEELARWQAATAGVTEAWIAEMNAAGKDREALVDDARDLIAKDEGECTRPPPGPSSFGGGGAGVRGFRTDLRRPTAGWPAAGATR